MSEKVVNVRKKVTKSARKLTEPEKDCVRRWLKLPTVQPDSFLDDFRSTVCPFGLPGIVWDARHKNWDACEDICAARFLLCKKACQCPCGYYSTKTVLRRARQMLEE